MHDAEVTPSENLNQLYALAADSPDQSRHHVVDDDCASD